MDLLKRTVRFKNSKKQRDTKQVMEVVHHYPEQKAEKIYEVIIPRGGLENNTGYIIPYHNGVVANGAERRPIKAQLLPHNPTKVQATQQQTPNQVQVQKPQVQVQQAPKHQVQKQQVHVQNQQVQVQKQVQIQVPQAQQQQTQVNNKPAHQQQVQQVQKQQIKLQVQVTDQQVQQVEQVQQPPQKVLHVQVQPQQTPEAQKAQQLQQQALHLRQQAEELQQQAERLQIEEQQAKVSKPSVPPKQQIKQPAQIIVHEISEPKGKKKSKPSKKKQAPAPPAQLIQQQQQQQQLQATTVVTEASQAVKTVKQPTTSQVTYVTNAAPQQSQSNPHLVQQYHGQQVVQGVQANSGQGYQQPQVSQAVHTFPTAHQILQYYPYPRSPYQHTPQYYYPQQTQQASRHLQFSVGGNDMFSQIAKITENLYLCGCHALGVNKVRSLGITHVINATMEIADLKAPDIQTIRIRVDDVPHAKLSPFFDKVADKIEKVRKQGGRVLVHCVAGVSRSSSLCIVYLMKYHRMTLLDAYNHVKSRRPVIRPNVGFFRQLIEYEKKLFGKNTVKMINSSIGPIPDVYQEQARNMVW